MIFIAVHAPTALLTMGSSNNQKQSVIMERLLQKRVTNLTENVQEIELHELVNQLRRSFPEYQRRNLQQFTQMVQNCITIKEDSDLSQSDMDSSDEADSNTQSSESSGAIDAAISDFMVSEGTENVNRGLRELYGIPETSTHPQEDAKPLPKRKQKTANQAVDDIVKKAIKKRKQPAEAVSSGVSVPRAIKYGDLGGLEEILQDIKELVEYPLRHPEVYDWLGVDPPRGVLLHGPPGCGKTVLAHAIAHECNVPFFKISAPEIVSGMSGESEAKIRSLFAEAQCAFPAIIFIDEIDAIAAKRENAQREMERRIVAQMLTCMDDLSSPLPTDTKEEDSELESKKQGHVIVIGATNRPDVLDPALRRAGRFDREISLGIPTETSRIKILEVMCRKLRLEGDFDFVKIARKTPGFVGADLEALAREAAAIAVTRIFQRLEQKPNSETTDCRIGSSTLSNEELSSLAITMDDFLLALKKVQPSLGREGFTTKPDITWADVGSLTEIREELSFAICQPILHPEKFENLGLSLASGVLLFGPPGCGKTLVAKAVANEAGTNFISIKGPELLNKYVGESERAVRQLFTRARAAHPCVLFFDEMDALAPKRGLDNNQAAERLVNQLLTEMDGMDSREGVYLVAATNRPDIIDPALLRPGRLDKILYVPLPDTSGRKSILTALSRKSPLAPDVDFNQIAVDARCAGFSGADLAALLKEASVMALKESLRDKSMTDGALKICAQHFEEALNVVRPSVSNKDVANYERMTLRETRSHVHSSVE